MDFSSGYFKSNFTRENCFTTFESKECQLKGCVKHPQVRNPWRIREIHSEKVKSHPNNRKPFGAANEDSSRTLSQESVGVII